MQELNERERKLYGRCVRLMVEGVEAWLDYRPGKLGRNGTEYPLPVPYFSHYFQSDLERYAEQLEKLGILIPLVDPPGQACCFELACSSAEAEAIAYELAATGPALRRLLASLFYFAGDKEGMTEEIGVEFPEDCYVKSIMQDMCDLGYATRSAKGYVWLPSFQTILALT
jgi:hypothetical protein